MFAIAEGFELQPEHFRRFCIKVDQSYLLKEYGAVDHVVLNIYQEILNRIEKHACA